MYQMQWSVLAFVRQIYNIYPQPVKKEYCDRFDLGLLLTGKAWDAFCATVKPYWFEEYKENEHLTWQQSLVLYGIDKALRNDVSNRISIASGHGVGKSTLFSILILWFLFAHSDCQVACTAPSADQMYDVLWKELKKWIEKMPKPIGDLYAWESSHVRIKESPATWFARAKTSSKENTEALAGVHADWVLIGADEASGIEEPIFETMEGALTSGKTLVFLISNPTRSIGYFYDTHHKDKERWQCYTFSSIDSPRVDQRYVQSIVDKYGTDSVQYAIRVLGQFPDEGIMDDQGYVQLFNEADIRIIPFNPDWKPVGRLMAALDPSGEGQDSSEWGARDRTTAAIIGSEAKSTPASLGSKSITLVEKFRIDPADFTIDALGQGHPVAMEIALATAKEQRPWRVNPVNVGEPAPGADAELYINLRAMCYYKMMLWARAGGYFMDSPGLKDELLSIRFKRTANGRIQMMDKVQMRKLGFKSPNKADALAMTFIRPDRPEDRSYNGHVINTTPAFDPFTTME